MTFDYKKLLFLLPLLALFYYSQSIVTTIVPFFAAFVLAGLIEPPITFLQDRTRIPRSIAVFIVLTGLGLLTGYLFVFVFGRIVGELIELGRLLPAYRVMIVELSQDILERLQELHRSLPAPVSQNIQESINNFFRTSEELAKDIINRSLNAISFSANMLFVGLITILATYFFSRDKDVLTKTITQIAPPSWQKRLNEMKDRIAVDLIGFIRAQFFLLLLSTLVAAIGLSLMGTNYRMLLAIIIGVLDMIPAIGPGIIMFPWSIVSFLTGNNPRAIQLLILYAVIFVARQTLQPKIFSDSVGIHPLAILVALYAGIVFFGFKGVFLGPILAIIIKAVWYAGLIGPHREEDPH
ncbi:MAG: sporulation integral membrane protein YtvI [Limnochordia bacterium]